MNYPVWEVPFLGGGLLIAAVAIVHVFISHFAVGGSFFLVLTERKAYREGDDRLLRHARESALFFILLTLVFGALTGVGIWFAIGLVSPSGTSTLIHVFVWAWAIEWVFFLIEVASAFVYYYAWDRLDRRTHLCVGWIYFGAAWMSLFVINGILTFMLTPGRWLETGRLGDAFFNPSFLPSLLLRTAVAVALACLWGLIASVRLEPEELRHKMVRYAAGWLIPAFIGIPVGGIWWLASIPPPARAIAMGGAPAVAIFLGLSGLFSVMIFTFSYFGPYRFPQTFSLPFAMMFLVLGFLVTGTTEWVREAVRKPYIIYGYMYSNAIRVGTEDEIRRQDVLRAAKWALMEGPAGGAESRAGRELFRAQCESCHTIEGYNGIATLVSGWGEEYVDLQLQHLQTLKGFMPPFLGTDEERRALARYLAALGRAHRVPAAPGGAR